MQSPRAKPSARTVFMWISWYIVDKHGTNLCKSVPSCTNFCTKIFVSKLRRGKAYYIYKYILVQKNKNNSYIGCLSALPFAAAQCCGVRGCGRARAHPFAKKVVILYQGPKKSYPIREKRGTKMVQWLWKTVPEGRKSVTRGAQVQQASGEFRKRRKHFMYTTLRKRRNVYIKYRQSVFWWI